MRAYLIIIFQIRQQHMSEVPLSEHNNVVKAFPSDRTDQPFGISILPRGAWRRWSVANAHRSKSSDEDIAIGPIAIADQIVGSPFPAESFRNLICNPFRGRMRCDAELYDLQCRCRAFDPVRGAKGSYAWIENASRSGMFLVGHPRSVAAGGE
jgi:hypothetical protein